MTDPLAHIIIHLHPNTCDHSSHLHLRAQHSTPPNISASSSANSASKSISSHLRPDGVGSGSKVNVSFFRLFPSCPRHIFGSLIINREYQRLESKSIWSDQTLWWGASPGLPVRDGTGSGSVPHKIGRIAPSKFPIHDPLRAESQLLATCPLCHH